MSTIERVNSFQPLVDVNASTGAGVNRRSSHAADFSELLKSQMQPAGAVHFSKHALQRLQERSIELSSQDSARLSQGIDRAASKGVQDSLVLLRDLALIVNVPSRTVVTAMPEESMREGIITNIDSAVLL
jgi:flagellar operon protein